MTGLTEIINVIIVFDGQLSTDSSLESRSSQLVNSDNIFIISKENAVVVQQIGRIYKCRN
jgi:hypothetical protein